MFRSLRLETFGILGGSDVDSAQDWVSHELVSFAAAFVLEEWLGYDVELVRLALRPQIVIVEPE